MNVRTVPKFEGGHVPAGYSYSTTLVKWYTCREEFHRHFNVGNKENRTGFFMSIPVDKSYNSVIQFMNHLERKINISDSISYTCYENNPRVLHININHFWLDNCFRFELLSILLRTAIGKYAAAPSVFDGVYREEKDFDNVIDACSYFSKGRPYQAMNNHIALMKFFDGYNEIDQKLIDNWTGWFHSFYNHPNNLKWLYRPLDQNKVRDLAWSLWDQAGRPYEPSNRFWKEAETQLRKSA